MIRKMERRDRNFIYALVTPALVAFAAAIFAYLDFAKNGIISPNIWIGTFLAGFLVFVVVYFISMTVYLWRFT